MSKSFGEILIGTTFNPSGQDNVQDVKKVFAELANLVIDTYQEKLEEVLSNISEESEEENDQFAVIQASVLESIYNSAITSIVNAQMSIVKLLTYKNQ